MARVKPREDLNLLIGAVGVVLALRGLRKGEAAPAPAPPALPGPSQGAFKAGFFGSVSLLQRRATMRDSRFVDGATHTAPGHSHSLIQTVVNKSTREDGGTVAVFFTVQFEIFQGSALPGVTGQLLTTVKTQRQFAAGEQFPVQSPLFAVQGVGGNRDRDVRVKVISSTGQVIAERLQRAVFLVDADQGAFGAAFFGSTSLLQQRRAHHGIGSRQGLGRV